MTKFTSLSERIKTAFLQFCGLVFVALTLDFIFMFAICLHVDKVIPQYELQAQLNERNRG